jgi:hypothetical protein
VRNEAELKEQLSTLFSIIQDQCGEPLIDAIVGLEDHRDRSYRDGTESNRDMAKNFRSHVYLPLSILLQMHSFYELQEEVDESFDDLYEEIWALGKHARDSWGLYASIKASQSSNANEGNGEGFIPISVTITTNHVGDLPRYGEVSYHIKWIANILSLNPISSLKFEWLDGQEMVISRSRNTVRGLLRVGFPQHWKRSCGKPVRRF